MVVHRPSDIVIHQKVTPALPEIRFFSFFDHMMLVALDLTSTTNDANIMYKCHVDSEATMEAVEQILGLKKKIRSSLDFVELSKEGVSKKELSKLADHLNIGLPRMAELISINARTIQRYTGQKVFSRTVSEHILRIAVVTVRGEEVFGNRESFRSWLDLPNRALGNKKPFDLLASDFGRDMVLNELGRLEHGIVS